MAATRSRVSRPVTNSVAVASGRTIVARISGAVS